MDEIIWSQDTSYTRRTNNLGGFEGGMTNGSPFWSVASRKPISRLSLQTLMSVDIETHEPYKATAERKRPNGLYPPQAW